MNLLNISENKLTLWTLYLKICNTFLNVPTLQLYSLIQHNIKMFRKKTEIAHLHISDNWLIKSHWTFSSDILSIIIPGTVISWSPHRSRHWLLSYPQHHRLASTFLWCSLLLWLIFVIIPKSIWSSFQQSDSNSCKITYAICCETVFCFCHWKSIVSRSPGSITSYLKIKHNKAHQVDSTACTW